MPREDSLAKGSTCELLFTLVVSTLKGPVLKASSSRFSSSSTVGWVDILKLAHGYAARGPLRPVPMSGCEEGLLLADYASVFQPSGLNL